MVFAGGTLVEQRLIRLWADRVRLARLYLEHPGNWPDGIDTKYARWYSGREPYWAQMAKLLDKDGRWRPGDDDAAAYAKWAKEGAEPPKLPPKTPDHKTKALKAVAQALVDQHLPALVRLGGDTTRRTPKVIEDTAPTAQVPVDQPGAGRPRLGPTPMTAAERKRRQRIRLAKR
jgi:hypothetical protein